MMLLLSLVKMIAGKKVAEPKTVTRCMRSHKQLSNSERVSQRRVPRLKEAAASTSNRTNILICSIMLRQPLKTLAVFVSTQSASFKKETLLNATRVSKYAVIWTSRGDFQWAVLRKLRA